MKFLPLVWKNIWRKKFRTIFTLLSLFVAFMLFGLLMTIRMAFTFGVDVAGADRLILIHKVSLIMPLPVSYLDRLKAVPGAEIVTHNSWFGAYHQDPAKFFANIAVEPEPFMKMYPEYKLPEAQMKAWVEDRQGAIIGRDLADRFNWKIGDRVPLTATIFQPRNGGQTWEFNIRGIYDGADGVDKTQFFFQYAYLDENRSEQMAGAVGWYIVKIADPDHAVDMSRTFDQMFANSPAETKTTTEKGFIEGFAKQMGDIGAIMIAIATAVLFNLGLVAGTMMAESVRERTNELGVLKAVGFTGASVLALVLAESLFIVFLGGGLGLAAAWLLVQRGDPTGGMLPIFVLPGRDVLIGIALIAMLGILAGIFPAMSAMRLRITDALRRS
jgi:putative ABC transport system permease protein